MSDSSAHAREATVMHDSARNRATTTADEPGVVAPADAHRAPACPGHDADRGQATAEYALVLLGAAAVALLLIGWATTTDQVSRLFDFVVDQVIGRSG